MPPFVPRKRARESQSSQDNAPVKASPAALASKSKPTVFDAVDQPIRGSTSVEQKRRVLDSLHASDDDSTSLSDVESDEFVDVRPLKKLKGRDHKSANSAISGPKQDDDEADSDDNDDDDEEDDMNWEDAIPPNTLDPGPSAATQAPSSIQEIGDVSISIKEDGTYLEPTVTTGVTKKGPSKRERQMRTNSHCIHVQSLMWHNTIRNSWLNDKRVQDSLLRALPEGVQREVTRWKQAMGKLTQGELEAKKKEAMRKARTKSGRKSNTKGSSGRDWNPEADHLEQGVPDLSRGDPLFRLLKVLAAYWRKRFAVVAPGLRKKGYMDLRRLQSEVRGWNKDSDNPEIYGERIRDLEEFRVLAERCEGSRDVGSQLFVALLRALGLETRLVASLQPLGFGWSKAEDAGPPRPKKADPSIEIEITSVSNSKSNKSLKSSDSRISTPKSKMRSKVLTPRSASTTTGAKNDPINIDATDSSLSSVPDDLESDSQADDEEDDDDDDDASIIEILPAIIPKRILKKYDRDLAFPIYWTEVCSPATKKFIPVDPIVLSTIGSNEELAQTFEPRGKKAELAKQVICYVVAHNADGSAKEVTVRYLKRHQLPGKTKGVRLPTEKVAIYNRKGKVLRYEENDWFKALMLLYERPKTKYTESDVLEEQTDLKPFQISTQKQDAEKESLQWYKQSAEFVLEQHLRREEALQPGASPVKTFVAGKGDKSKEHAVYRRSDVVACKTVESWHKEGRALRAGEHPMKLVPMRAVTLVRKREMEDAQRETGEKLKQGLYSRDQTEWIIPPPIKDGIIPKNAFGNMDVYVPTMVPKGAVHLPLKGSARICRKLEIDFAEACTGFEFGKQRAVPVLTGVVVAKENERMVRDAWRADQAERKRKEDTKRTAQALHWWRKMLLGLRVVERMRIEYQGVDLEEEDVNPFVARAQRVAQKGNKRVTSADPESNAGGFLLPSDEEEQTAVQDTGTPEDGDDDVSMGTDLTTGGGGFLLKDDCGESDVQRESIGTPQSLQSAHSIEKFGPKSTTSLEKPSKLRRDQNEKMKKTSQRPGPIKSTPTRSQYFAQNNTRKREIENVETRDHGEGIDNSSSNSSISNDMANGTEDLDEMSDEEVIQPRRTTARTRSSKR